MSSHAFSPRFLQCDEPPDRPAHLATVPGWVRGEFAACLAHGAIFLCAEKVFCQLDVVTLAWSRLPPPIGESFASRLKKSKQANIFKR
jgi:hypothetical protein